MISVEQYLATSFSDGDREYVDGQIVERNVGEHQHARIQALMVSYFLVHFPQYWAAVEARVKLAPRRYRIPDVCLLVGTWPGPARGPVTEPLFIAVEVLSPDERVGNLQDRVDDYLNAGVKYVWVVNPDTKRGYIHTSEGSHDATDGVLRTADPNIEVPLAELFK